MQNLDKSVRHLFLSDGWYEHEQEQLAHYLQHRDIAIFNEEQINRIKILVQVDESGADALIVAYLCRKGKFRELFLHGVKPHIYVAINVFGAQLQNKTELPIIALIGKSPLEIKQHPQWEAIKQYVASTDDWAAHERYYYIAKMICHAANYGMKGPTFALNVLQKSEGSIRLSIAQAKLYLDTYHKTFPEIYGFHNEIQNLLVRQKAVLHNLFNEPRQFNSIWGDELFREAYAFIPASTVGQIINKAKTKMQTHIEYDDILDTDMLQNGHDSALVQTAIGQEKYISDMLQHYINVPLVNFNGEKFNMKSEAQIGCNWGPMKVKKDGSIYNPLGMRGL